VHLDLRGVLGLEHDLGAATQIQTQLDRGLEDGVNGGSQRDDGQEQAPLRDLRHGGSPSSGPATGQTTTGLGSPGQAVSIETLPHTAMRTPTIRRNTTRPVRNSPSTPSGRSPRRWRYQA